MNPQEKIIEKLKQLVKLQDEKADILISGWNNDDNAVPYPDALDRKIESLESELALLESQMSGKEPMITDEEIMTYFDNHAVIYPNNDYALHHTPFLTRSGVLVMFHHFQFRQEPTMRGSQAGQGKDDLQLFMDDIHQWADKTFGAERTALAPLHHLKKEVDEAIEAMQTKASDETIEELADCFILILNSSSKYNLTFKQLLDCAKHKMEKNKARKWGKPDVNGVVEHVESLQPAPDKAMTAEREENAPTVRQGV